MNFIFENKKQIIILSFIFLVGLITGLITINQLSKVFSMEDLTDVLLKESITGDVGFFAYFFRRFCGSLLCLGMVFLFSLNFYSGFINYIFIFYRGYLFGSTLTLTILLLGIGGAINVIIFYIPIQILLACVLIMFSSQSMNNCFNKHRYGKFFKCINTNFIFTFALLTCAICLIEALLLPPILKSVIYVA